MAEELLVPQEKYLEAGVHIGTKIKTADMSSFIYRARQDGLFVLDLKKMDERVRAGARMMADYEPSEVLVVASRTYASNAANVFSKLTGVKVAEGRFIPGMLTNPSRDDFSEPKLLLVCDPKNERQAVREAVNAGIPVIALCDSDNNTKFIDFVVPCNNKGKKALALIFYLFARELLKNRGIIAKNEEFATGVEEFEEKTGSEEPAEEGAGTEEKPTGVGE